MFPLTHQPLYDQQKCACGWKPHLNDADPLASWVNAFHQHQDEERKTALTGEPIVNENKTTTTD